VGGLAAAGYARPCARVRSLARWIGLHHRNLAAIWVTHMHIDHYGGLSVLQRHFPDAQAIATPKSVELMPKPAVAGHKKVGLPDTPDAIEGTKRYLTDFGRLKESAISERELYDEMTRLYPDWASNQTWLMFGLG